MQTFSHVEQPDLELLKQGYALRGNWKNDFFKNQNPLVLELGCGMGEYSVGLAEKFPNKNFLGIDIKGARMWQGAKSVLEKNLTNVGFLRIRIDWIEKCFATNDCKINKQDGQLKKEITKQILAKAVIYQKQSKDKNFKPYRMSSDMKREQFLKIKQKLL